MSSCLASGTFVILESYQRYYNEARTHLSLCKDAPVARAVQAVGGSEDCTIDTSPCGASN